jgi:hypothetical protein
MKSTPKPATATNSQQQHAKASKCDQKHAKASKRQKQAKASESLYESKWIKGQQIKTMKTMWKTTASKG